MKKLVIFVGALSALTNLQAIEPTASKRQALTSCVKPRFYFELAAVCASDDFNPRHLFTICKYINFQTLPALCGLNSHAFEHYFDLEQLQKFLSRSAADYDFDPNERKTLLKRSLHIPNWERLLACTQLEPVITIILDLIYADPFNTPHFEEHIRTLDELIRTNAENNLLSSFNLEALKALLLDITEKRIEPDILSKAQVLKVISPLASIKKYTKQETFTNYVSIDGLWNYFQTIILADNHQPDELSLELLIDCISWKNFLGLIPRLLHMSNTRFAELANLAKIEEVIAAFQSKTDLTAQQIADCFNQNAFPFEGVPFSWITGQINFDEFAHALNELRKGRSFDISRIGNPEILQLTGFDFNRATDPHRPYRAQLEVREDIIRQITETKVYNTVKYHLLPACYPLLIWLLIQGLCPTCLNFLTPPQMIAIPLALMLTYALLKAHERLEKPTFGTRIALNGAAHAAVTYFGFHILSQLRERQSVVADIEQSIISLPADDVRKPAEQALRNLVASLTDELVTLLPRASNLLTLLTNPAEFILDPRNELFITKLYDIENQRIACNRLDNLTTILETIHPISRLSHNAAYEEFIQGAQNKLNLLSCLGLVSLARYNPRLLTREQRFIRSLNDVSWEQFIGLQQSVPR